MKNILIINAHPNPNSLINELANIYKNASENVGAEVKQINLYDIDFDYEMPAGYKNIPALEPCLSDAQDKIKWSDHMVWFYPTWWGLFPGKMKGFIDRTILPGFGFKYHKNSSLWDKLLKGKSARLIVTMDSPKWYYNIFQKKPGHSAMKYAILGFCGVKPVKITTFARVKFADSSKIKNWKKKVEKLGKQMA